MAAVALNAQSGEGRSCVGVEGVGEGAGPIDVAGQAFEGDGPSEVWIGGLFIAGRHVPDAAGGVVREGRLEEVVADLSEVADRVVARTDGVGNRESRGLASADEGLQHGSGDGAD